MFFRTLGVRVVVCGGGHRGWDCVLLLVGGRVDSWVGIARRGCVLLLRGGGSGIAGLGLRVGTARRDCASGLRFVVEGCARGIAGLALRVGIAFSCWRVRDCRIAGLRFLLKGGEEQQDSGIGRGGNSRIAGLGESGVRGSW